MQRCWNQNPYSRPDSSTVLKFLHSLFRKLSVREIVRIDAEVLPSRPKAEYLRYVFQPDYPTWADNIPNRPASTSRHVSG